MPWQVYREKGEFCLHKKNPDGSKGDLVHCHKTAEMARRQQAALYVSENKEMTLEEMIIIDEDNDGVEYKELDVEKGWGYESEMPAYASGATSFAELESEREARERVNDLSNLMSDFQSLAGNIVYTPVDELDSSKLDQMDELYQEFKDRASKLLNEETEKARREDVSAADKKRAVGEYGDVTYADEENKKYPIDTEKHIRAAWNYIRMPRNAAKYADKGASIKRKIIAAWKKKIDSKGPPSAKETFLDKVIKAVKEALFVEEVKPDIMVYKEEDGKYGWVTSYSNNFMDRDNPPDIIASIAHEQFVEKVDKGTTPLPELELWHVPEWKIGYATAVAYDDSGFPIAIGRFDDNKESQEIAEWLSKQKDFGVSHGMWNRTIQRDPEDPSVIIAYETHEISPLPKNRAANVLADWYVIESDIKELEEVDMTIPAEKRQELLDRGLPEETLSALEERNKKKAETATAEGIKSKETEEVQPVPETTPEPETEKPVENKDAEASEFPTRQEVAEAVANVIGPIVDDLGTKIEAIGKQLKEAQDQLNEFKVSDEKRIKEIIQLTPRDSLATMMTSRFERASSSKQTKVGEGDNLLKTKPREEENKDTGGIGIPFIDKMTHGEKK